ncbi:protein YgfX [Pseudomonas sp. DWP3-1-2]|uniref:protein YgfX n=1 Tax=Pseudomonas sp. DWP3-1-2 TaxID=2804645 RepID=UPI003CF0F566
MSSLTDRFECRWQPSRWLLAAYLGAQVLALLSLFLLDIPLLICLSGVFLCVAHGWWVIPNLILLNRPSAFTALRRTADGWQLWNRQNGWQGVQLCRDSMALPLFVILRFRLVGRGGERSRWARGLCIPRDAMAPDDHRRLRVRLKFSRRRWAAPE